MGHCPSQGEASTRRSCLKWTASKLELLHRIAATPFLVSFPYRSPGQLVVTHAQYIRRSCHHRRIVALDSGSADCSFAFVPHLHLIWVRHPTKCRNYIRVLTSNGSQFRYLPNPGFKYESPDDSPCHPCQCKVSNIWCGICSSWP